MATAVTIQLPIDGHCYEALCRVEGYPARVTVTWEHGSATTQQGGLPAGWVARRHRCRAAPGRTRTRPGALWSEIHPAKQVCKARVRTQTV